MEKPKRKGPKLFGAEYVTHAVEIAGQVNHPQSVTAEELRAMELTEVRDLTMICGSGRTEGHIGSYRGVRLSELLKRADVVMRDHDSPNWTYVTLHSSDGHWEIFSYGELFNTVVGDQAIVIVERDGRPLGEEEGEISFVSANDKRLGPRKLRYLQRIVVHEHEDE